MNTLNQSSTGDISDVFCCSVKDIYRLGVSPALHRSCREYGYFFITDVDTPELALEGVFSEAAQFFNLSIDDKLKNISLPSNQYLGYRGIGTEKSVMTGAPELCEQYKFGYFHDNERRSSLRLDFLTAYEAIFKQHTQSHFHTMEQIANQVLMIIADNFNLGREYFVPYCNQPTHQMGLNYYPIGNLEERNDQHYAMSAHKDLCLLTIIAQNESGLVSQDIQGTWKPIAHVPNTLIVMLGDYLERWTNHYYLAPVHRVIESAQDARTSIIYKHRPNYETVIPVIPGINIEKTHADTQVEFHTGKAYEEKINRIMSTTD